ncbi:MAG: TRAP transporter substrate-binding protein DctP [Deltaproteobacteria bacterium]|nr:TRAP transporter substrate-binding protein DctP [Deltaproteobacteria bacterium]
MKKIIPAILTVIILIAFISVVARHSSAAELKKYNFRYATFYHPDGWGAIHSIKPWFEQVEKATNGQIVFEPYWSGSLAKAESAWGSLQKGIVDVGDVSFHNTPGLVVLHNVITLPFLNYQSAEHESIVTWKLYENFQEIQNEYKDNKILLFSVSTPFFFVSNKKQIKSREDFKGLKTRAVGGECLQYMVELAGGIPVSMPGSESYSALEKGVIDAASANWSNLLQMRIYEVAKYYFFGPFNAGARGVCMSHQAWNSLTPDLQQKIMSVSGLEGSRFWSRTEFDASAINGREKVKSEGYELNESVLSPEKIKEWKDLDGEKIWNAWIKLAVKKAKEQKCPEPEALVKRIISSTEELIEANRK